MDRRIFLQGGLACVATPVMATAPERSARPLQRPGAIGGRNLPSADDLVASARLPGRTSLFFADLDSGDVLAASGPLRALPPASVAKSLTALYAIDRLGVSYRFETQLAYRGALRDGRLDGDLVLLGGGDPTLTTDDLAALAAQAKAQGLREVSGRLLVWGGHFPKTPMLDSSQPDHVGYNPTISGLNLNFNRVHFEWRAEKSGYTITLQARTARYRPPVATSRMDVVDRAAPVYTFKSTREGDHWSVARRALGRDGSRWLPVRVPAAYAGDVLNTLLRSHGIVVKGYEIVRDAPVCEPLSTVQSAPLGELCEDMLKYSTNLTAECIGLAASRAGTLPESAQAMSVWARERFGARHTDFVDHSGLGVESRISARDMVMVLQSDVAQRHLRPRLKPFRLRDRAVASDVEQFDVRAKTGTLNFVSGLAGYASGTEGSDRPIAFAIFSADLPTRRSLSKSERESPVGGRAWSRRARVLQSKLIRRFAGVAS